MADQSRRLELAQLSPQRHEQRRKLGNEYLAGLNIDQTAGMPGTEAQVHVALGVHLDAQTRTPPVPQRLSRQQADGVSEFDALTAEKVGEHATLVPALRRHRQVLHVAATALAVMGAGRRDPLGRRLEQCTHMGFVEALAGTVHRHLDTFARQRSLDEQRLAGSAASHAPAIVGQALNAHCLAVGFELCRTLGFGVSLVQP